MNTLLTTCARFISVQTATATLVTLPLLTTGLLISSAQAAPSTFTTHQAPPLTDLFALSHPLVGTWQATDTSVLQMLDTLYGASGSSPENFTGNVYLTFDAAGTLTITYDELQLLFPASTGLPPVTLRGSGVLSWSEDGTNVVSVTGQSYDFEAEVLGMAMPAPPVPMDTSTSSFEVVGDRLSFINFDNPGGFTYLPGTWLRAY